MSKASRNRWLSAVVVTSLFVLSCGGGDKGGDGASMPAGSCVIKQLGGAVTVNGEAVKEHAKLEPGAQVEVPQNAFARLEFADGTKIFLTGKNAEGTSFTISEPREEAGLSVMLCKLGKGFLSFMVPSTVKGKGRYDVETETSLTVIRGTEGKVQSFGGTDTVALKSGTVDVTQKSSGQVVTINLGNQVVVPATGAIGEVTPYDFSNPDEAALYGVGPLRMKTFQGEQ